MSPLIDYEYHHSITPDGLNPYMIIWVHGELYNENLSAILDARDITPLGDSKSPSVSRLLNNIKELYSLQDLDDAMDQIRIIAKKLSPR